MIKNSNRQRSAIIIVDNIIDDDYSDLTIVDEDELGDEN